MTNGEGGSRSTRKDMMTKQPSLCVDWCGKLIGGLYNSEGHSYEVEMNEFADLVSWILTDLVVWKGCACVVVARDDRSIMMVYFYFLFRQQRSLPRFTCPRSTWQTKLKEA